MAEGVFAFLTGHLTQTPRAEPHALIAHIDSAGTGAYHVGDPPDPRTMSVLEDHKITTYEHSARKFREIDFEEFDYILAMDDDNLDYLKRMRARITKKNRSDGMRSGKEGNDGLGKVMLFGDFGGSKGEEVVDPYYGARNGFEIAYEQMVRFSKGFIQYLETDAGLSND
jgi:low molecular weight phosphotyrosine protein phosphatase